MLWFWSAPGLVSSNDGSHLALARAQVLRGETTLGGEVALTLFVDRAHRQGRQYSDRPPGTAWLAGPAIWVGAQLDPGLLEASRDAKVVIVQPAASRYAETYVTRVQRMRVQAPILAALQGTTLMMALHCALMGTLGLIGVVVWLRRREVSPAGCTFAMVALGLGSLWGPYSTVLFSHVTAGTLVIWCVLGLEVGTAEVEAGRPTIAVQRAALFGAGLAAGAAAATDYLVGVLVLGLALAYVPPRRWLRVAPWLLLGTLGVVAATLAYHDAAFGSPWSIGYDHHANFEFARTRGSTFSGSIAQGLWSQWGTGEGAGVLALAPVMLVGVVGCCIHRDHRWVAGAVPWIVLLAAHRTPTGGAAVDHRYLVPLMPVLALGLGLVWQRWVSGRAHGRWVGAGLLVVALVSGVLAWSHVLGVWV